MFYDVITKLKQCFTIEHLCCICNL